LREIKEYHCHDVRDWDHHGKAIHAVFSYVGYRVETHTAISGDELTRMNPEMGGANELYRVGTNMFHKIR